MDGTECESHFMLAVLLSSKTIYGQMMRILLGLECVDKTGGNQRVGRCSVQDGTNPLLPESRPDID